MPPTASVFAVEPTSRGNDVLERVAGRLPTRRAREETVRETCFDTFDWRLLRKGLRLVQRAGELVLDGESVERASFSGTPGFAWELPAGALRDRLDPVLEVRRLLRQVEVERRLVRLDVLDEEEKTVARVVLENGVAWADGGETGRLSTQVRVQALRGYEEAADEVRRFLAEDVGLARDAAGGLLHALSAAGVEPWIAAPPVLDPDDTAERAMRRALATFLDAIELDEAGVRDDVDTEFLHDFRVAVRRSRSVLDQIDGVLPAAERASLSAELAWLGRATGLCRDLDVFLLRLDPARRLERSVGDGLADDFAPLRERLEARRAEAHRSLARVLAGRRYRALRESFHALVDAQPPGPPEPHAAEPARSVVGRRIRSVRKKMLKLGRSAGAANFERVHRVRIQGKKLRYLLDGFRSLWPEKDVERVLRDLKRLQSQLGDFNDAHVQQRLIGEVAAEMAAEGGARPEAASQALLAMGRLLERLDEAQDRLHRRFSPLFARFAGEKVERHFERLLEGDRS